MVDKDKFLATFRINQDEFQDFMAQALRERVKAPRLCWLILSSGIERETESPPTPNLALV